MEMTRKELMKLMPADKNDLMATERIVELGFPTVASIMWDMVKWMRVAESPVADAFADFFGGLGEPAVEVIQRGLMKDDCLIRYRILTRVLPKWPAGLLQRMTIALGSLMTQPDACDNDIRAAILLLEYQLVDVKDVREWILFKKKRLSIRQDLLSKAGEMLKQI